MTRNLKTQIGSLLTRLTNKSGKNPIIETTVVILTGLISFNITET